MTELLFVLAVFIFGSVIGSFLHVVVDRLPRKETILRGKSHCDMCGHKLAWNDLIPLVSYLLLSGKCRYCHKRFGSMYPIVEFTTGFVFASTFLYWYTLQSLFSLFFLSMLVFYLFIVSTFIIIFFTDLKYGLIPFAVVAPATLFVLFFLLVTDPASVVTHILAGIGASAFFFFLHVVTKGRGMGFGDVVLVFYLGLILGYPGILLALYLAFLTGAFVSLILILGRKKKLRGSIIPFGPFLIVGSLVSMYVGDKIIPYIISYLGG